MGSVVEPEQPTGVANTGQRVPALQGSGLRLPRAVTAVATTTDAEPGLRGRSPPAPLKAL